MKLVVQVDANNLFVEDVLINDTDPIPVNCIDVSVYPVQTGLHLPQWNPATNTWSEGKVWTLAEVQSAKITEVTNAYNAELNSAFTSSATGNPLVYDYSTQTSQDNWKDLKSSVSEGYIPDTVLANFPITLANGTTVLHNKAQLQQIFGEMTMRVLALHGAYQALTVEGGTIMSAGSVEDVNKISWVSPV